MRGADRAEVPKHAPADPRMLALDAPLDVVAARMQPRGLYRGHHAVDVQVVLGERHARVGAVEVAGAVARRRDGAGSGRRARAGARIGSSWTKPSRATASAGEAEDASDRATA